jgi:transposase
VLAGVRATVRLESALEALRRALNSSTVVAPDWLRDHSSVDWIDRYGRRCDESRLPSAEADRRAFAGQVGEDGHALLAAAYGPGAPSWLAGVPAVETLRWVWLQQFAIDAGRVNWRTEAEVIPPASQFIGSPYDVEAGYGKKRSTS